MIKAYFNGIKDVLRQEIQKSKESINIAVAWFTRKDLFSDIIDALERGVSVSIILIDDIINRNEYGLDFSVFIEKGGHLCFVDTRNVLMHNKFCIFDNVLTITGSYNWTYSAERRNSENIIITDDSEVVKSFYECFSNLWSEQKQIDTYSHIKIHDFEENDFIKSYDNINEEFDSMISEDVLDVKANHIIEDIKNNIAVTRLATLQTVHNRKKPQLKETIGMRCIINGKEDKVLHIIQKGQLLPATKTVSTVTAEDDQSQTICDVVYGNSEDADDNKCLLKINMDDIPLAKAGGVKFNTKVTLDTNGYMHVEYVCINNGIAKEAVYINPDLIQYE